MSSVGIPDEDSWFRRSYLPSGTVTGWRRMVLVVMAAIAVLLALLVLVVVVS